MPDVLGHMGVQAAVTRLLIRNADPKWIYVGCVIPDLPWIGLRVASAVGVPVDPYDTRLYFIGQASLACCLLLSAGLALLSTAPKATFAVLGLNSLFHLLLDPIQIKWGNGVHLLAPFSWKPLTGGLFWPDDLPSYVLTAFGAGYALLAWRKGWGTPVGLSFASRSTWLTATVLIVLYLVSPVALTSGPEAADADYMRTLRDTSARSGRVVEFDRSLVIHRGSGDVLRTFAGEDLKLDANPLNRSGIASVRARFRSRDTLEIVDLHFHRPWLRDVSSAIGLAWIVFLWTDWLALPSRSSARALRNPDNEVEERGSRRDPDERPRPGR